MTFSNDVYSRLRQLVGEARPRVEAIDFEDIEVSGSGDPLTDFLQAIICYDESKQFIIEMDAREIRSAHLRLKGEMGRVSKGGPRVIYSKYDQARCLCCECLTIHAGDRILYAAGIGAMHEDPETCIKRLYNDPMSRRARTLENRIIYTMKEGM